MPAQFPATIELSDLNGKNGFMINGISRSDESGASVSYAGDLNNDGKEDLIIGAPLAKPNGFEVGQCYIIFGSSDLTHTNAVELSSLNGETGFKINGIAGNTDFTGKSVASAGDINNDGVNDLIIGAPGASQSYVIFGNTNLGSGGTFELSDLDGNNGFTINSVTTEDQSGHSVSSVGDINDDGIDDVIIGAYRASPSGQYTGQSYVVFGGSCVGATSVLEISSLDGTNGFKINGIAAMGRSGYSVSQAGDVNNDGIEDLIIGAPSSDPNGESSGQSYVIFGKEGIGATGIFDLSSLSGANGFMINGIAAGDNSGFSVSSAGDINNDGIEDLIIGAPSSDPNGASSGQSYVIFGKEGISATGIFELSSLSGANGFIINGIAVGDKSGFSVSSAGDINGNGITDLIVGAPSATPNGDRSGQSYVIFGEACVGSTGSIELSHLNGINGFILNGMVASEYSGSSVSAAGDINDDTIMDLIIGAPYANINGLASGQCYVVLGDSPIDLLKNYLAVSQEQSIILSDNNLNATSIHHLDDTLQFIVSDVQHGQFEFVSYPDQAITLFYKQNVTLKQIQFISGWSPYSPSYNVSAFTGRWSHTVPTAATVVFGPLIFVNNNMVINQGGMQLLTSANLFARSGNISDSNILFTIDKLQYGKFEKVSLAGKSTTQFTQQQINEGEIQFSQDGTPNIPNLSVVVTDGIQTLSSFKTKIEFYYLPTLQNNFLSIQSGQMVLLSSKNLQAIDRYVPALELNFTITALEHGMFSFVGKPQTKILKFTQGEIDNRTVQFVHDGSVIPPSYNVSVQANNLVSASQAALISWLPRPPKTTESAADNAGRNVLIGVSTTIVVLGMLLASYITTGLLRNHRLKSIVKIKQGEEARYYSETVIPLASEIFNKIKITGFMNYISTQQMEIFVSEIATVANEISQLGINVDIQHMNSKQSKKLLTEIVAQMKHHLNIKVNECNKSWFTRFFKPQITPEMIGEKAQMIAEGVYNALLKNEKIEEINPNKNFDLVDVVGQGKKSGEFTTSYVKMP